MPTPLISTKLHIPPAPSNLVSRPHLIAALDAARESPQRLILVSAPAGFGKTTLVAEWLRHVGQGAAWLSLDRDDNDPLRFWRYLVTALQTADPGIGRSLHWAFETQTLPPLELGVPALVNDLAGSARPILLVLDDYHLIETESIHYGLNYLIDRLPADVRIVITTRADPPLRLARLRSNGQLTEARTADLRFTCEETADFLNRVHQLDLPEEDISRLAHLTEGWIVGLQLAALTLHRHPDRHAFVAAFAGDDRHIVDYLLQEVLDQQPPPVRTFLLQTSILDRLCSPLCEAVTGLPDGEGMIRRLEESNLFLLPLDNRRYWYRYHTLFADLLRRRLNQEVSSAERIGLYRRAALWFEREGLLFEAITHSLAAPDHPLAADLLERHALTFFFRSESSLLRIWLKDLPADFLRSRPLLSAVYAHTIAHSGIHRPFVVRSAEIWLDQAKQAFQNLIAPSAAAPADPEYLTLTRNFIALSEAFLATWHNEDPRKVIELAQQALAGLPPADRSPLDSNYHRIRSGLNYLSGLHYIAVGDSAAAERAFLEARIIGEASGDLLNAFASASGQFRILHLQGRLPEAAALCREALNSIGQPGEPPIPYAGLLYVDLGKIQLEWNEVAAAEESIQKGLGLLRMAPATYVQAEGMAALADILQIRGDTSAASALLQADKNTPQLMEYSILHRVRTWIRQGETDAALGWALGKGLEDGSRLESLALCRIILACTPSRSGRRKILGLPDLASLGEYLERRLQAAEAAGWTDWMIELLLLQALAWQADGDSQKAIASLRQSLSLAREGGYVRRFINEGPPVYKLLKDMEGKSGALDPYIERLLAAGAKEENRAADGPQPLAEPLSRRELEVLRLMASDNSNAEIATKLVITPNTTKKHITHIFRKLGVTNRSGAILRARELGLVA
ncbi:MAG: AAA family ATPase [Anaerolineales bacterium]|nr:AAA family ATPase [Anaerolineales bacterium]